MKDRTRRFLLIAAAPAAVLVLLALAGIPYATAFARFVLSAVAVVLVLWLLWRLYRSFLYKVGRRLAFSYFLLGVLPIPLLLLLLAVLAYILAGFYMGHLYRDAVQSLHTEMAAAAQVRLDLYAGGQRPWQEPASEIVFGYYRGGKRVAGDKRTPAAWPAWTEKSAPAERGVAWEEMPHFVAGDGGRPTLAAVVSRAGAGVVALFVGDLDLELSQRSKMWVETYRSDDPDLDSIGLTVSGRKIPIQRLRREQQAEAVRFFKGLSKGERFWDDPVLGWGEISGPLVDLAGGERVAEYLAAHFSGTPRTVLRHLFSSSAEIDAFAWATLLIVAFLLFDVYAAAALMAIFMIVGLSRAVNRLSRATAAVRRGDFSVRIPVRRRDQVGDLQRSFNEMTGNLETLVDAAAEKELLEKELALARNLQKSLLPTDLPAGGGIEFATLFEPSAAIGGDYFDVLRLAEDELAVVIADVSGHGLSSGLRMAMLKAGLLILVEETRQPEEILRRLDAVVRSNGESRFFVTATLGLLHLKNGTLVLTNAGHPPTYLVRQSEVKEILLPSSPLGGLGHQYGRATLDLQPGDAVVWLSDGLIEATGPAGEPFGYDAVVASLQGTGGQSAAEIRNRLLAAVERHCAGQPASDDQTLMVLRYGGPTAP